MSYSYKEEEATVGAPGIATRSKDATVGAPGRTARNKQLLVTEGMSHIIFQPLHPTRSTRLGSTIR